MTLPKRRANIKYKNLYGPIPDIPDTLGKEVDAALKEWYTARGQEVPADEIGIGAVIDAAEAAETAARAARAHRLKVLKNAKNQLFHLLKPAETQLKLLYLAHCTRKNPVWMNK